MKWLETTIDDYLGNYKSNHFTLEELESAKQWLEDQIEKCLIIFEDFEGRDDAPATIDGKSIQEIKWFYEKCKTQIYAIELAKKYKEMEIEFLEKFNDYKNEFEQKIIKGEIK